MPIPLSGCLTIKEKGIIFKKTIFKTAQNHSLSNNSSVVLKHILGWVLYLLYYIVITYVKLPDFDLVDLLLQHVMMIGVFYANIYLVYDNLFSKKRYLLGAAWFIFIVVAYAGIRYLVVYYVIPVLGTGKFHYDRKVYLSITISFFVNFCIYSAVYWLVRNSMRKEYQLRLAERQRLEAEKAKIKSDYSFLKAQVSPHFLHNTLNFLYAKLLPYSKQLSDSVLLLSEIMRYALNEEENAADKVLLTRELHHIENIININQLRFSDRLNIEFEVIGQPEGIKVISFIIITLVENAFKHGVLLDKENPIKIRLEIDREKKMLYLQTHNKKTGTPAELSTGIGLNNLRKRLDWVYGDNYVFTITEDEKSYSAYLELSIDES
jgi:sensor histidine kinase YesM